MIDVAERPVLLTAADLHKTYVVETTPQVGGVSRCK